jgi:hypothetical protein
VHGITSQKSINLKSYRMPHSVSWDYEFLVLYVKHNNTYASTCLTACIHLAIKFVSSNIKHKLRHYIHNSSNHLFQIENFFLSVIRIETKLSKCNVPLHTIRGNGGIAPPILYLGSRRRSVVSFNPSNTWVLGKELTVPTQLQAGWAPEPIWTYWGKEKLLPCLGI